MGQDRQGRIRPATNIVRNHSQRTLERTFLKGNQQQLEAALKTYWSTSPSLRSILVSTMRVPVERRDHILDTLYRIEPEAQAQADELRALVKIARS